MPAEAYGYDPLRVASCPCGWGGRFAGLRVANIATAAHLADACEGCDHVIHLETLGGE